MMYFFSTSLFLALSVGFFQPAQKDSEKIDSFDRLIAHVKGIAAKEDWKKEGWTDAPLQEAIDRIAAEIKAAGKVESFKVPVSLADVKPTKNAGSFSTPKTEKALIVLKSTGQIQSLGNCKSCVILAEGTIWLPGAEDCIVIAGGSVQIGNSKRNFVVARHDINVEDGDPKTSAEGSILIAGAFVEGSLRGSLVNAPRGYLPGYGNKQFVTVNTPNVKAGTGLTMPDLKAVTEIKDAKLTFEPPHKPNPLADKLDIVQTVRPVFVPGFIVTRSNGVEIVIRMGAEVTDNLGKPVPDLAGWKLDYMTKDSDIFVPTLVFFAKGDEEIVFELKPKRTMSQPGSQKK